VDFTSGSINDFSEGAKSGEISIYPLETKKMTLFAKHLLGKCQISKSGGCSAPWPPSDAHGSSS